VFLRGRRNPAWFGRWREDVIEGDQVKRVRRCEFLGYKKDFPTERLALRELEARVAPVNRPNNRPLRSETFAQFCGWWKKNVLTEFKPSSQASFSSQLRVHFLPYFGPYLMKDIQWQTVQTFMATRAAGAKTRKNLIFTLKLIWSSARAGGWVAHNPFEDLKLPKVVPPPPLLYTAEEAKLIIANAEGQYKTLFWIAAETGLRAGELAGLRIENLQLDEQLIRVTHSIWGGRLQEPKSKNAKRSITITPQHRAHPVVSQCVEAERVEPAVLLTHREADRFGKHQTVQPRSRLQEGQHSHERIERLSSLLRFDDGSGWHSVKGTPGAIRTRPRLSGHNGALHTFDLGRSPLCSAGCRRDAQLSSGPKRTQNV